MKKCFFQLLFLILPFYLYSQHESPYWKHFSGVNEVSDIEVDGDTVWVCQGESSGGGVSRVTVSTGAILNLNASNTFMNTNQVVKIARGAGNTKYFGTNNGIYKWDGNEVRMLMQNSQASVNQITIKEIEVDDSGDVWFTRILNNNTQKKELIRYNGTSFFVFDSLNSNLPNNDVKALTKSKNGDIYIIAKNSLLKYDGTSWVTISSSNPNLNKAYGAFCIDALNHAWINGIVNSKYGIHFFNGANWAFFTDTNSIISNNGILNIAADDNGSVYIAQRKIIKSDGVNWTVYDSTNTLYISKNIYSLAVDDAGFIWYYDAVYGLIKTDFTNFSFINTSEYSIPTDFNEHIAIAKDAVWFNNIHGFLKYSNNTWTNNSYYSIGAGFSNGIAVDTSDRFWGAMVYQSGGSGPSFYACDDTVCSFQGSNTIGSYSFLCDGNNNLWTENYYGLYKYDGVNQTQFTTSNSQLYSNSLMLLHAEKNDFIWLSGSNPGVIQRTNGSQWQTFTTSGMGSIYPAVFAMTSDMQGNVYAACSNNAAVTQTDILKYNGISWSKYATQAGPPLRRMIFDHYNNLWCIDIGEGFSKYADGVWTKYTVPNSDLAENNLMDIKFDQYNNLWLSGPYSGPMVFNENGLNFTTPVPDLLTVGGHCFFDIDSNGVKDTNEPFLPNQQIIVQNNPQNTFTNSSGAFQLHLEEGTYTIALQPQTGWHITTDSLSYHISLDGSTDYDSLDFGISASRFHTSSGGMNAGLPRCGFTVPYWINYTNTGSAIENGMIAFTPDTSSQFISASPAPDSVSGNTYFWKYSNLNPFASVQIVIQVAIYNFGIDPYYAGNAYVTDVSSYGYYDDDNFFVWNESDTLHQLVRCAFDPNEKQVSPEGVGLQHSVSNSDTLEYIIHFQNVGNDTAFFVKVIDTLDIHLDPLSVQLISASHPYIYSGKKGILNFNFPNCNLPDSSVDYSASCGYIRFRVRQKSNFTLPAVITNKANIYFNFNAPIQTNETYNTVVPVSIGEAERENKLMLIYPNPSSDFISIKSVSGFSINKIKIIDSTGKIQWMKNCNNHLINADIKSFSNGIYFMEVTLSNGKRIMDKFTVLH